MNKETCEKMSRLQEQLKGVIWVWFSADGSDRLFDTYLTDKCSSPTYALIYPGTIQLLVSTLDADINFGIQANVYSNAQNLSVLLADQFKLAGWPQKIFLNFSESGDPKVDSLGHGQFLSITDKISQLYKDAGHLVPAFESAEDMFYLLIEQRSTQQIEHMKVAAHRAEVILKKSFAKIKAGMSEHEILHLIQRTMQDTQQDFCKLHNVTLETYSWNEESCPIVLVGPNLQKGGHAETSEYCIKEGETIYADFGVKLTFSDGGTVSSDLQRMAYLPRQDEENAPATVQKVFDVLSTAISEGINRIQPGMLGYEVDDIVRSHITEAGFPSYDHSTGHPIGEVAHSPGTLIGKKENPRSHRKIQSMGTYTIEPRCQVINGGSIEEMVLVTDNGGVTLCDPQTKLWVVGRNI